MDAQLENYTNVNIFKRCYEKKQIVTSDDVIEHTHNHTKTAAGNQQRAFNPYTNNMGTTIGKLRFNLLTKF